jgi:hypothetical protein
MITTIPINTKVHKIDNGLSTHVLKRGFVHQLSNGKQLGNSLGRSSPKWNPLGGPPFNPLIVTNGNAMGFIDLNVHPLLIMNLYLTPNLMSIHS